MLMKKRDQIITVIVVVTIVVIVVSVLILVVVVLFRPQCQESLLERECVFNNQLYQGIPTWLLQILIEKVTITAF